MATDRWIPDYESAAAILYAREVTESTRRLFSLVASPLPFVKQVGSLSDGCACALEGFDAMPTQISARSLRRYLVVMAPIMGSQAVYESILLRQRLAAWLLDVARTVGRVDFYTAYDDDATLALEPARLDGSVEDLILNAGAWSYEPVIRRLRAEGWS